VFIGIGISFLMEERNLRVTYVMPNGAASGLLFPNDVIVGIISEGNRVYFSDLDSEGEVISYLSGKLGDEKELIVGDPDLNKTDIKITYKEIKTPTAHSIDLGSENIGYVRINRFSGFLEGATVGTSKVFSDVLNEVEASFMMGEIGRKTLIIDLRDNPGGALTALHNAGNNELIPGIAQQLLINDIESPLFQMIPRSGEVRNYHGGLAEAKPYNIKVLVNENSASAAEVLAAALHYNGGYEIWGQLTRGKAVFQNRIALREINNIRYSLVFTEGRWFFDNGKSVDDTPLNVNLIEQRGIKSIPMPIYGGLRTLNQVSGHLSLYQLFLNYYFNLEGAARLRTDGFFDQATRNAFLQFQNDLEINQTGNLDRTTAIAVHEIFMTRYYDWNYDFQLSELISHIEGL